MIMSSDHLLSHPALTESIFLKNNTSMTWPGPVRASGPGLPLSGPNRCVPFPLVTLHHDIFRPAFGLSRGLHHSEALIFTCLIILKEQTLEVAFLPPHSRQTLEI